MQCRRQAPDQGGHPIGCEHADHVHHRGCQNDLGSDSCNNKAKEDSRILGCYNSSENSFSLHLECNGELALSAVQFMCCLTSPKRSLRSWLSMSTSASGRWTGETLVPALDSHSFQRIFSCPYNDPAWKMLIALKRNGVGAISWTGPDASACGLPGSSCLDHLETRLAARQ